MKRRLWADYSDSLWRSILEATENRINYGNVSYSICSQTFIEGHPSIIIY